MKWSLPLLLATLLSFAEACMHHRVEVAHTDEWNAAVLSFLEDNRTTRNEIISNFGDEHTDFEKGRILIFWLDKQFRVTKGADKTRYHLVLVFQGKAEPILKEHSLVRIK